MPEKHLVPDEIPRSRSGRVPQWVLDEARGRPVGPVPFRPPTASVLPPPAPRRSSARRLIGVLLALVAIALPLAVAIRSEAWFSDAPTGAVAAPPGGVVRQGPPPGHEESATPLGTPPAEPAMPEGSGYRFGRHQDGTTAPVAWSPCRPIHYVVRPANEPPDGAEVLREAFAEVSGATGLQFVADGETDEGPAEDRDPYQPERYGNRWAPVLVAWATPDEVPDFGVDIVGEAGPVSVSTPSGTSANVSGVVYLDAARFSGLLSGGDRTLARAVVLHELGHLVGLAHVNDSGALMFPRASGEVTSFGPGDRAGLAALGRGACQPTI